MFAHPAVWFNATGALLTGVGAVLSAWLGYRSGVRRHDSDCDKRLREIRGAMMLGMTLEKRNEELRKK